MAISGENQEPATEMAISRSLSLRDLSPGARQKLGLTKEPRTAAQAREMAFKSRGMRVPASKLSSSKKRSFGDGGYMVPDPQLREQITIPVLELPNRVLVGAPIVIRYNDRPGT
jgi:hypothetical protein